MDKKALIISAVIFLILGAGIYYFFFPKIDAIETPNQPGREVPQENYQPAQVESAPAEEEPVKPISTDASGSAGTTSDANLETNKKISMPIATIETNKGTIKIELYKNDAPKAVENFMTLANKKYYDGVIFHRVISGFMIQGGDPTGTGRGGPGYQFEDEFNTDSQSYKDGYKRGTVAMANSGPNTNGSQFFIMHQDYPLPHNYTIFGRVIYGQEVVDAIAASKTDAGDRPLEEMKMTRVSVTE